MEIKFRVWDKESKKLYMQDDFILTFDKLGEEVFLDIDDMIIPLYDYELMQYTGFKDTKDKEICEGDIVRRYGGGIGVIKKGRYSITDPEGKNHIGFYIHWKNEEYMRVDLGYWLDTIRVIGNVYENKELLED